MGTRAGAQAEAEKADFSAMAGARARDPLAARGVLGRAPASR